jgi:hypothetical protein
VAAARRAPLAGGTEHPDHVPGASAGARQLPALRGAGPGRGGQHHHARGGADGLRLPGRAAARQRALDLGKLGRIFISPAYHRIHHSATGRLDINLGTVFAIWDVLSRRAVFPAPDKDKDKDTVIETGLSGRPIPVEQAGPRPRLARTMLTQLAEPFISTQAETR